MIKTIKWNSHLSKFHLSGFKCNWSGKEGGKIPLYSILVPINASIEFSKIFFLRSTYYYSMSTKN